MRPNETQCFYTSSVLLIAWLRTFQLHLRINWTFLLILYGWMINAYLIKDKAHIHPLPSHVHEHMWWPVSWPTSSLPETQHAGDGLDSRARARDAGLFWWTGHSMVLLLQQRQKKRRNGEQPFVSISLKMFIFSLRGHFLGLSVGGTYIWVYKDHAECIRWRNPRSGVL